MGRARRGEAESLTWIHRVRAAHYRRTKDVSVDAWLKPVDPQCAQEACLRLGLKVRLPQSARRLGRRWV